MGFCFVLFLSVGTGLGGDEEVGLGGVKRSGRVNMIKIHYVTFPKN